MSIKIDKEQVEGWIEEVEGFLRYTLGDVITPEGSTQVIRYKYIPNSARLEKITHIENEDKEYLDSLLVSYICEVWELGDPVSGTLPRPFYPHGLLEIPIGKHYELLWDNQDAIAQLG